MRDVLFSFYKYLQTTEKSKETLKGYRKELKKAEAYFTMLFGKPIAIKEIKLQDLEDYLYSQLAEGLSPATRSHSYYILRSFYAYCYKKELVDRNIALNLEPVRVKRKERTYLKKKEALLLLDQIKKDIIQIAVYTILNSGLRISECTSLKVKDVDIQKGIIHVVAGKGNKDRDIPINDSLLPVLEQYLQGTRPDVESDYFFATKKTGKLSNQYVNAELKAACERLGWEKHVSAHILRHSFASRLVKKDVNLVNIQKLLGHSDLRVTSIYTHTSPKELKKAVNKLR